MAGRKERAEQGRAVSGLREALPGAVASRPALRRETCLGLHCLGSGVSQRK